MRHGQNTASLLLSFGRRDRRLVACEWTERLALVLRGVQFDSEKSLVLIIIYCHAYHCYSFLTPTPGLVYPTHIFLQNNPRNEPAMLRENRNVQHKHKWEHIHESSAKALFIPHRYLQEVRFETMEAEWCKKSSKKEPYSMSGTVETITRRKYHFFLTASPRSTVTCGDLPHLGSRALSWQRVLLCISSELCSDTLPATNPLLGTP